MFLSASCDRGFNCNNPKWNLVCLSTDTLTASLVLIQEETGPQRRDRTLKGVRETDRDKCGLHPIQAAMPAPLHAKTDHRRRCFSLTLFFF